MFQLRFLFYAVSTLFCAALLFLILFGLANGFTNPGGNPHTGTSTSMWFYSGGNLGIGTSTPSYTLDIVGDIRATSRLKEGAANLLPSGMVMFFDSTACPTGWSELTSARGRYLVGLISGGTLGATAGTALSNQENRVVGPHTHNNSLSDPLHAHGTSMSAVWGFNDGIFTGSTRRPLFDFKALGSNPNISATSLVTIDFTDLDALGLISITNSSAGTNISATSGTNAPYIQYLACEKT